MEPQIDLHPPGSRGVAADVGERLLQHPVQGGHDLGRQRAVGDALSDLEGDARPAGAEALGEQAQVGEGGAGGAGGLVLRAQHADQAAHRGERLDPRVGDGVEGGGDRLGLHLGDRSGGLGLDHDAGDVVGDQVVQLPGQLQTFGAADGVDGLDAPLLLEAQVAADARRRGPADEQHEGEGQAAVVIVAHAALGHQHAHRHQAQRGGLPHGLDVPQDADGENEQRAALRRAWDPYDVDRADEEGDDEGAGHQDGEPLDPVAPAQHHRHDADGPAHGNQELRPSRACGDGQIHQQHHAQPADHGDLAEPPDPVDEAFVVPHGTRA
ncbi:hypothetical protein GCM10018965_083620 [Nonomuraea roseola]